MSYFYAGLFNIYYKNQRNYPAIYRNDFRSNLQSDIYNKAG